MQVKIKHKIERPFFMYTLSAFLLDYDKMNLLRTDEVFFIGLATTTAVKKKKKQKAQKQKSIKKNIMIRSNIRDKRKKRNYKKAICQDRYVLHPDTDSLDS